jgi:cell division protein FtsB
MRKIAYIIIIIGLILMINGLLRSIYDLWHKQDLVTSAKKQLDFEKEKNQKLKVDFQYSQTQQFIESQAYNKLFLVKPGEEQVLISQNAVLNKGIKNDNTPNWQKWLNLFF